MSRCYFCYDREATRVDEGFPTCERCHDGIIVPVARAVSPPAPATPPPVTPGEVTKTHNGRLYHMSLHKAHGCIACGVSDRGRTTWACSSCWTKANDQGWWRDLEMMALEAEQMGSVPDHKAYGSWIAYFKNWKENRGCLYGSGHGREGGEPYYCRSHRPGSNGFPTEICEQIETDIKVNGWTSP